MIIIDKTTIIKNDIKKALKGLCTWVGLFILVSVLVDLALWINEFSLHKTNAILKVIISIPLWLYINKEEKE